ncbi:MAG: polysaccharide lyase [Hyphomicrobium sp.]
MASSKFNTTLFNLAGGAIFLGVSGYMVASFFHTETVPPCSMKYPPGQQFSLDNGGDAMSAIELQGRAGFREYGLLANASVEKTEGRPWSNSLVVKLATTNNPDSAGQNGVGYVWPVRSLKNAQAVCLSYDVYLSKDVDMKAPGHLPGLLAEPTEEAAVDASGFNARLAWSSQGNVAVDVRSQKAGSDTLSSSKRAAWPREKWVRVNQEIEFNAPGKKSGAVRVWVDGNLDIDSSAVKLRSGPEVVFTGVSGDTGYSRELGKEAAIKISPFVVQWR